MQKCGSFGGGSRVCVPFSRLFPLTVHKKITKNYNFMQYSFSVVVSTMSLNRWKMQYLQVFVVFVCGVKMKIQK